jgi:hypothetical protein
MPEIKLKLDLSGKDAVFLSNTTHYISGLSTLELFRNHPERVPSLEQATECVTRFKNFYEGGLNGDRVQAAMRTKARRELTAMLKQILHYLQAVAGEDDLQALMQVGIEVPRPTSRRRAVVAPA